MHASVGDRIVVQTELLGQKPRQGTVQEVLGTREAEHYRVTWDDGHESFLYPGPDTRVIPAQAGIPEQQAPAGEAPTRVGPHDPVERIMSSPVITTDSHDSLRATAGSLTSAGVGALVVMSGDTPLGIITERDVVHALAAGGDPDEVWAADVIGIDTVWASPTDTITHVAALMRDAGVRHIPLRVAESVIGIVSVRDVLKVLLRR